MCPELTELLSWNGQTVHVCCLCQRAHTTKHSLAEPIFIIRVQKTAKKKSLLAEKFVSRVTRQPRYHCIHLITIYCRFLAQPEDDYCKSKHVALVLYSLIAVLTAVYSNKLNILFLECSIKPFTRRPTLRCIVDGDKNLA